MPRPPATPSVPADAVVSFARLDAPAPLPALQAEVAALLGQDWVEHVNRNDYAGGWDVLPLRCQRQHLDAHPILQGFAIHAGDDWQDLPVLASCPALSALLRRLQCPLRSARLMRLKAGAHIRPHRDHGLSLEQGQARLHLPIETSDHIRFLVDGRPVPMRAGELWYFNADQMHEVHNLGEHDRINLVIDCVANAWLVERIHAGDPLHWADGADTR